MSPFFTLIAFRTPIFRVRSVHRYKHDIHHADAAYPLSHRRHRQHEHKDRVADLVPQIQEIV
jgi:hypothetical protein